MDSKNYLRLKDKESVKGLFVGDPYEFRRHWVSNKSVLCSEDNTCVHCGVGIKSSFSFRINFLMKDGDNYVCKIFEQGWTVYDAMRQINTEYDLEKHLIKISRTGTEPTDTSYSILPVPNGTISPDTAAILAKIPLQDLRHKNEPDRIEKVPTFDASEELPF